MDVTSYKNNLILKSDSYKYTQWKQYPPGTSNLSSYMEARQGAMFPSLIFAGLQPYLKMLEGPVITLAKIHQANQFCLDHFGAPHFNLKGWIELYEKHRGYLPIRIRAVDEGTEVPIGNAIMIVDVLDEDPKFVWVGQFFETLLMKVWYPITIATNSFYCKKVIKQFLDETSDNPDHINSALHDFGYRGVSSEETAALGAMSHLINFMGTDTLAGIIAANEFYNNTDTFKMYGFSVAASEHSTATPWGKGDGELKYIQNMLEQYPVGPVSMVIDSYDTMGFAHKVAKYKLQIEKRDGRVILRPDSGDPVDINVQLIQILESEFGSTTNSKGFKVLPNCIRVIQGDGIDYLMIQKILLAFRKIGFSAENIVFGSGGGLLQKFDRDSMRFAIKCSFAMIDGKPINVQKDPITATGGSGSTGSKKSKTGLLKLVKDSNGKFYTMSSAEVSEEEFINTIDYLVPVFENGVILKNYEFETIRKDVNSRV